MVTEAVRPAVVSWRVDKATLGGDSLFQRNHHCFSRAQGLTFATVNATHPKEALEHVGELLRQHGSVLIADTATAFSPQYSLQRGMWQDMAKYLATYDVIVPVTHPPSPLYIGSYALYLKDSSRGRAFLKNWMSTQSLCERKPLRPRGFAKNILYATILGYLAETVDPSVLSRWPALESSCSLERKTLHAFFMARCFELWSSDKSVDSMKQLLLDRTGILLAHEPFSFNAAVLQKGEGDVDQWWKGVAADSLLIHAGGVAHNSEVFLRRLASLLGYEVANDGCIRSITEEDQRIRQKETSREAFWHLLEKTLLLIMLLCLVQVVLLAFFVFYKLA
jgi:hypothetical protein